MMRQLYCGSSHLLPPVRGRGAEDASRVPTPSLTWVHGRKSGDMMIDGVPGVRVTEGVRPLNLSGSPPNSAVATGRLRELAAGIS